MVVTVLTVSRVIRVVLSSQQMVTYDSHENTILTREMSTMADLSFSPNVDVSFSLTNLRNPEPRAVDATTENDISFTVSEGGKSSDV